MTGNTCKVLFAAAVFLSLSSCVTQGNNQFGSLPEAEPLYNGPDWLWYNPPEAGAVIVVASGALQSNRDSELTSARQDAARQVGIFAGFVGSSQYYVTLRNRGTAQSDQDKAYYSGKAEDIALEQLELLDSWQSETATWARFRLPLSTLGTEAPPFPVFAWEPTYVDTRDGANGMGNSPTWINTPPVIPGWHVSVAQGARQSSLSRTLRRAEETALFGMLQLLHGRSNTRAIFRDQSTRNSSSSGAAIDTYEQASGEVRGFMVISRWLDSDGTGWALAVSPR